MTPELKEKWIAALVSGEYKQGRSWLKRTDNRTGEPNYCCLGVLCDIVDPTAWVEDRIVSAFNWLGPTTVLTDGIRRKFGLSPVDAGHLMAMNGGGRKSFKTIAKWISDNL